MNNLPRYLALGGLLLCLLLSIGSMLTGAYSMLDGTWDWMGYLNSLSSGARGIIGLFLGGNFDLFVLKEHGFWTIVFTLLTLVMTQVVYSLEKARTGKGPAQLQVRGDVMRRTFVVIGAVLLVGLSIPVGMVFWFIGGLLLPVLEIMTPDVMAIWQGLGYVLMGIYVIVVCGLLWGLAQFWKASEHKDNPL